MKETYQHLIKGIVYASVLIFIIVSVVSGHNQNICISKIWSDIGTTSAIVALLTFVFNRWLWKIPFLGKWLNTPNLNGEWEGEITYKREKESGELVTYKDKVSVHIEQTYLSIIFKSKFSKSESCSYCASFVHDSQMGTDCLSFQYYNTPNMSERQGTNICGLDRHIGSSIMKVDWNSIDQLQGEYWTDRPTRGEMKIKKIKE